MCGTPVGVSWTYHLCVGLTMLYKNNKEYTIRTFLVWINPNCILQGSLFNSDGQWFDKLHSPTVIHCISFHSSITCMLTVTTCKLLNGMQRNMWMAVTIGQILNIGPPLPMREFVFTIILLFTLNWSFWKQILPERALDGYLLNECLSCLLCL